MTTSDSTVNLFWRFGDPWRDLRPEIEATTDSVVVVTARGSVRVLHPRDRWQMRLPESADAPIVGDGIPLVLASIELANPCGIITWGDTRDSWSASTPLVLLAAGDPTDVLSIRQSADVTPDFVDHPPGSCGALYCQGPS